MRLFPAERSALFALWSLLLFSTVTVAHKFKSKNFNIDKISSKKFLCQIIQLGDFNLLHDSGERIAEDELRLLFDMCDEEASKKCGPHEEYHKHCGRSCD